MEIGPICRPGRLARQTSLLALALALVLVLALALALALALGCHRVPDRSPRTSHARDAGGRGVAEGVGGSRVRGGGTASSALVTPPHRRGLEREARDDGEVSAQTISAYREAMEAGDAALYSGLFDKARRDYLEAMGLRPDRMSPALGALRTMMLRGHGEARLNIEHRIARKLERLRARPETIGAADLLAARMAIAEAKTGAALDQARLAVQALPKMGVAWRVLGEAAAVAEQWGTAVAAYRKAASLGLAAKSGTLERLADALDELGARGAAERAAHEALALTGKDPRARRRRLNLLGVILEHAGERDRAGRVLAEALALGPRDPAVLHDLGALAEARGKYARARSFYLRALAIAPVPMTSWRLGHVYRKMAERQKALEAFIAAAAHLDRWTWPRSTRWWPAFAVGRIYAESGFYAKAIGWFRDALREARTAKATRRIRSWATFSGMQAARVKTAPAPVRKAPAAPSHTPSGR